MKIISGERGNGISTDLVLEASIFDGTILTMHHYTKDKVALFCKENHLREPEVITITDLKKGKIDLSKRRKWFIEDVNCIFVWLLKECDINLPGSIETICYSHSAYHRVWRDLDGCLHSLPSTDTTSTEELQMKFQEELKKNIGN